MFLQLKYRLKIPFAVLFFLLLIACEKSNGDDPKNPPTIINVTWTEESGSATLPSVIQKDIIDFQSLNLGNSRTVRILVPGKYDADSVSICLSIELENDAAKEINFDFTLNSENYIRLPGDRIIKVPTGKNTIKVRGTDSLLNESNVFELPDFNANSNYKVLYVNDGQDFGALNFRNTLGSLYSSDTIEKLIVVGIDASGNRLNEYGTVDSTGNPVICYSSIGQIGTKAKEYTKFLTEEVIPYINQNFRVLTGPENTAIMGSSVGGLSAFNIAWMNPDLFGTTAAFSGSFWWRGNSGTNPSGEQINQARIMHKLVKNSEKHIGMKFWFEAGTNDETDDRDNDGIIDAIDDTKDLMKELETLGYIENQDFVYVEVPGGQHNQTTWAKVLDDFLIWNYKK